MGDPVLHVIAGPNGAGKSTFFARALGPTLHLPFVNADEIAAREWPGAELTHAYDAASLAAAERRRLVAGGESFITETVFSHDSKVDLLREAEAANYRTTLHVLLVPVELAVVRVSLRVEHGGHAVPEEKIRSRYDRLWPLIAEATGIVDEARVYDTSDAHRTRRVATFAQGRMVGPADWPAWTPEVLQALGS